MEGLGVCRQEGTVTLDHMLHDAHGEAHGDLTDLLHMPGATL